MTELPEANTADIVYGLRKLRLYIVQEEVVR